MPTEPRPDRVDRRASTDASLGSASSVDRRHRSKLERALRRMLAADSSPQVPLLLWVSGPPGCGRATLLREIRGKHEGDGVRWIEGSAFPGTGEILEPILRGVRELVNEMKSLADGGFDPWRDVWKKTVDVRAPALCRVLPEVPWGKKITPFPELEPRFERSRLLDHLAGLVLDYAEHAPLVLQIDGAEFLDGLSRDAVATLVRVLRTRRHGRVAGLPLPPPPPLALVLVSGERETPPLEGPDGEILNIPVRGLDRREFVRLIESEYGAEQPLSVIEKLYQLTRGNRFDIERRISWEARESDGGTPEDRAKRLLEFGNFDSEVAARVRRRAAPERGMLQALAVLGKPVSVTILERMCGIPREEAASMIGRLAREEWIVCDQGRVVRLSHERLRSPISDTLDDDSLEEIHCQAAEAIAEEYSGRENRRFQEVYFHQARGRKDLGALEAAFHGAEEALRLYDFEGAIAIYRDLLRMIGSSEPAQVERGIGAIAGVLCETSKKDEALLGALEKLLEKSEDHLTPPVRASLWRSLGQVAGTWGLGTRELDLYQRAFRALSGYGRTQERIKVYASLARAFLHRRRLDETMKYCRQGFDLVSLEKLSSDPEFLELCFVTEQVHFHRKEYVEALSFEERYLKIATLDGSPILQIESLLRLANLHEQRGEFESARTRLLESIPIARGSGSRLLEARTQERIGHLHAKNEEWVEARDAFQRAFEVQSEIGDEHRTIRILGSIGLVSLALGKVLEGAHAFRLYALYHQDRVRPEVPPPLPGFPAEYRNRSERDEEIRRLWIEVERPGATPKKRCLALQQLGDLHRDCGEMEKARSCLRDGLRLALEHDLEPSRFYLRFGRLSRLCGDASQALASLQKGLDAMATDPQRDRVAETLVQVGLLHSDRGDARKGLTFLERGLRAYLELEHEAGVAHVLIEISRVLQVLGENKAAEGLARASITLCASLDLTRLEGEAWLALGASRTHLSVGMDEFHAAGEIFTRLGVLEARARVLLSEAELREKTKDSSGARALCQEATEICRDLGLEAWLARCLALRGKLEGSTSRNFLAAIRSLDSALGHATAVGDRRLEAQCHRLEAVLYRERGSEPVANEHDEKAELLERHLAENHPFLKPQAAPMSTPKAVRVAAPKAAAKSSPVKAQKASPDAATGGTPNSKEKTPAP